MIRINFEKLNLNLIKYYKIPIILSVICILASTIIIFNKGFNFGTDFKGGTVLEIRIEEKNYDIGTLRKAFSNSNLGEAQLQTIENENENITDIIINISPKDSDQKSNVDSVKSLLSDTIKKNIEYRKVDFVGPSITKEIIQYGIIAVLFALVGIWIYIWARFDAFYAFGGILALIHDLILTLAFYSITGFEFNSTTIAAILTILGYSINDSVIIYDRIRMNMNKYRSKPLQELINISINSTFSRTIMTSTTTFMATLVLFLFGGSSLESFCAGLMFGILIGTYSSIYISAPILILKKKTS